ncbi:NADH:ubiquinone reductase (Na(+)-transporting) subunit C [Pseudoruegeria sp. HB172150]|uniref:NADH:ubiquinone reductase (Na(+)-transporting) subunit C n=1 Tax=Pseudoruegeria sp. HB172150 TaxID=2721164 RepID=UPI0015557742|nr:NADH:ubiquinone reductase (Na(+)-transporting) subunit C [Pseudoruegeria sp. HB172150]
MADSNPVSAWQRFLAAPNDSRFKTLLVAFLVSAICAVVVTGATVVLRPIQQANRAAEQQLRLETMLNGIPGMSELLADSEDAEISTVVVDLDTGRASQDITPETLQAALDDPANWTTLTPEQDMANIGVRPNYQQIYIVRDGDDIELVILPVFGAGAQGEISAMLAIDGDMETFAGITIIDHVETPGLGARITEPGWQANFNGTRFANDAGEIEFAVARGPATSDFEVDGITGATRTGNSMTRIVRFWLGPMGYGPLLDAIRRGEF